MQASKQTIASIALCPAPVLGKEAGLRICGSALYEAQNAWLETVERIVSIDCIKVCRETLELTASGPGPAGISYVSHPVSDLGLLV